MSELVGAPSVHARDCLSTYLGGKANGYGYGIATNVAFNLFDAFVIGSTTSINFPALACFQCANGWVSDAFVVGIP